MIQSFRCEETFHLFTARKSRGWSDCSTVALKWKPLSCWTIYEYRLGTVWSCYEETVRGSTAFASTTNGVSASSGKMTGRMMLKSLITTRFMGVPARSAEHDH